MLKKINIKDFKVIGEIKKIRKDFKPDIIHLHTTKPSILGRYVFRKEKNHIVYTIHGFDTVRVAHRKFLFIEKFFQRWSGATVAVSKYDEKNIIKEGITKNVNIIYNGIGHKSISPAKTLPFEIKESKKIITIARIMPPKDFSMFINVARHFEKDDTAFIWMGSSQNKSIEDLKKEYQIPENVYLTGDMPNASNYLSLCDVFVLFSHYEGLPMSIIEAMSQGLPAIVSDVGGDSELVDDSNGALVKDGDVDSAVKILKDFLSDKNLLEKKGKASFQKFQNMFTLEKMWDNYENLYKQLLKIK
jgi:glycosyltransferase involved in cell wall biosynthesis